MSTATSSAVLGDLTLSVLARRSAKRQHPATRQQSAPSLLSQSEPEIAQSILDEADQGALATAAQKLGLTVESRTFRRHLERFFGGLIG